MPETLSIRIDAATKKRLDALAKRSGRSKSFLAAEAIAAYVEPEEWQLGELQAGIAELGAGREISHEKVAKWLSSWGKPGESLIELSRCCMNSVTPPTFITNFGGSDIQDDQHSGAKSRANTKLIFDNCFGPKP